MKKYMMVVFFALTLNCMQKQLQHAIQQSDLEKVQNLLDHIKKPHVHDATPLLRSASKDIDLEQLHTMAQKLLQESDTSKNTRQNLHFYKRVTLGIATLTTGLFTAGYYFYQSTAHGQSGSYKEFLTILCASGGLIGHGSEQIRLGIGNYDAHNLYAKNLAISHLIDSAWQESVQDTSL